MGSECLRLTCFPPDTELDKSVADQIGDPLVHLIRNAVDHGVEDVETRLQKGKDEKGKVLLSATHEGNHIIIRIKDDGAGMDPENLPESDPSKMDFSSGSSKPKSWKEIWGSGQGINAIKSVEPVAALVDRLEREYHEARSRLGLAHAQAAE